MRSLAVFLIAFSALSAASARPVDAESSEGADWLSWERLQGRITLATPVSSLRAGSVESTPAPFSFSGASLMGDYYLGKAATGWSLSGFRATSGLLLGTRGPLWGHAGAGSAVSLDRRWGLNDGSTEGTTPYVGLGYTSWSPGGSWRFSADMGLMSLSPGNVMRMGRVMNGSDNFDDMVRAMRLSRVLQVGVSYAF